MVGRGSRCITWDDDLSKERDVCDISHIYVTLGEEEEEIYPPTIAQIAEEQRRSRAYKPYFKSK